MLARFRIGLALVLIPLAAPFAHAAEPGDASFTADVADRDGAALGTVTVAQTPSGMMHITVDLRDIPEGVHGIHLHETGDCGAADFSSAGGHIAGDRAHGIMAANGPHPGDLPNAHVQQDGRIMVEHFNHLLAASMLTDADGAAFIVHSDPDDYTSQPSGDAGERIACGVFAAAE
ncbi:MAG: superoxide dismutase family protein [Shimia sp.]